MKTKREKVAEKKAKCAKKKAKAKGKRGKVAACVLALLCASMLTGCQSPIERGDPASKSARTTYGAISIVCYGDGSSCTFTLGDGAFTAADGDGASSATANNAARADADLQMPGDVVSAGIQAAAHVVGKGIDAYSASKGAESKGDCKECTPSVKDCANCTDCAVSP